MKTTTVKNDAFPKFIGIQVATCPECGALLERNEHPFDKKIPSYLGYPFAIFAIGLITNQNWLKYISALLLASSIVIIIKKITSKEYKQRNVWREYENKI